jgi:phosphomannomutase
LFFALIERKIEVVETPVGFKYIGDVMENNPDKLMIGG